MKIGHSRKKTNYVALLLLSGATGAFLAFTLLHEPATATLTSYSPPAQVVVGSTTVTIPSWSIFSTGNMWQLVSAKHALPKEYAPQLVTTSVEHAPGAIQVARAINAPLNDLVAAASAQGVSLMLSSAYRSYDDQAALYDSYLAAKGLVYVQAYVALPGQSEHQSGLAVDLSSSNTACVTNGDNCSLDAAGIAWLRAHAADFGFIERYPEGKQSITGISGEHWHYRYVGVPLARALTSAGMTFDEFVQQAAPAFAK